MNVSRTGALALRIVRGFRHDRRTLALVAIVPLVVMVLIVATADIGAYFSGKTWGRHKLAEVVSPKKTWEGFWGGLSACAVLALLLWSQLPNQQAHVSLAAALVVTGGLGQGGYAVVVGVCAEHGRGDRFACARGF